MATGLRLAKFVCRNGASIRHHGPQALDSHSGQYSVAAVDARSTTSLLHRETYFRPAGWQRWFKPPYRAPPSQIDTRRLGERNQMATCAAKCGRLSRRPQVSAKRDEYFRPGKYVGVLGDSESDGVLFGLLHRAVHRDAPVRTAGFAVVRSGLRPRLYIHQSKPPPPCRQELCFSAT